jgi:hypothetical protein
MGAWAASVSSASMARLTVHGIASAVIVAATRHEMPSVYRSR